MQHATLAARTAAQNQTSLPAAQSEHAAAELAVHAAIGPGPNSGQVGPGADWELKFAFHYMGRQLALFVLTFPRPVPKACWRALTTGEVPPGYHDPYVPDSAILLGSNEDSRWITGSLGTDGRLAEVYFEMLDAEGEVIAWIAAPAKAVAGAVTSALADARARGFGSMEE